MSDSKLYINLILETIDRLETSFNSIEQKDFLEDLDLQDATLMRLQVLGENIKKIPYGVKNQNKDIRWKKFEKLRNIISHKYSSVDYNLIWSFIKNNLDELKLGILNLK